MVEEGAGHCLRREVEFQTAAFQYTTEVRCDAPCWFTTPPI